MVVRAVADLSGPLVVIGCGNLNRRDDGAGVAVIRRLQHVFAGGVPPGVRLFDAGTGGVDVMFQARGARVLVVVDACRSGSEPGAIFELPGSEIETPNEPRIPQHDFRWDHAIAAGRRIFGASFPSDVTAILVEAGALDFGLDLTAPVAAAVETVAARLAGRIRGSAEGG